MGLRRWGELRSTRKTTTITGMVGGELGDDGVEQGEIDGSGGSSGVVGEGAPVGLGLGRVRGEVRWSEGDAVVGSGGDEVVVVES